VAVVNEAFARKFNLTDRVIGKRMALGSGNKPLDIEIVGLVRDAKYDEVREPAPPQFVMPYRQADIGALTFYVRAGADTLAVLPAIAAVVRKLDANIPISRGIPAIAIGAGGRGGDAHTHSEWFDNVHGTVGVARALTIVMAAADLVA